MNQMFRNGNIFKQWVSNFKEPQVFIFDLDKTLWDCKVEHKKEIKGMDIFQYTPKERHYMLTYIQDKGHEINIGSRSSEPEKCKDFLRYLFPNIHFNNIQIFPTPEFKQNHVKNILNGRDINEFIFFDEEHNILQDLKKTYPQCTIFHTPNGLYYETFNEQKNNINK
jgi:hypothetical protein